MMKDAQEEITRGSSKSINFMTFFMSRMLEA